MLPRPKKKESEQKHSKSPPQASKNAVERKITKRKSHTINPGGPVVFLLYLLIKANPIRWVLQGKQNAMGAIQQAEMHIPQKIREHSMTKTGSVTHFLQPTLKHLMLMLTIWVSQFAGLNTALAQEGQVIFKGDMAVTGFSGIKFPDAGLPPGIDPLDETFIDPEGASLRIFNVKALGGLPTGQYVNLPEPFKVKADQIGQVFGLAFDDGIRGPDLPIIPNLYVTSSVLHGLQITAPDSDDDGRPERLKVGAPNAEFMEGQFGEKNGGTPGAIWKIDGESGVVSLFANVTLDGIENSGPGLGNIAFDKRTRQLFVSDLDTGMIHRYDLAGNDLGTFDHGLKGRIVKGLAETPFDPTNRMDIKNPSFKAADPSTWGFADQKRIVYGLQARGTRLYYYAKDEHMIMSVGINKDGSFGEAQWELDVSKESLNIVTDIAFDNKGFMYLSQRGDIKNLYDYSEFAVTAKSRVLRYHLESPDDPATPSRWVEQPAEYAVGFEPDHKLGTGVIDLQYGYHEDGTINYGACEETLLKTGENLRFNEELKDQLAPGGPYHVHGVQFTNKALVRPLNTPPWTSYFTDFDGIFEDPEVKGHVGDVEVWRPCKGQLGENEYYPYPEGEIPPLPPGKQCIHIEAIDYWCGGGQLNMDLYLTENAGIGADSLKATVLNPGISVTPQMQTVPPVAPFTLGINGAFPGEPYDLGVCLYKQADADAGGEFPCCKAVLPLNAPDFVCGP